MARQAFPVLLQKAATLRAPTRFRASPLTGRRYKTLMKSLILNTLDDIRSSYWFIPSLMATISVILSYAAVQADAVVGTQGPDWLEWLFDNQPDGARAVLSTIAGSMVTVAGVVFSITLVTVSNAAFQFGPRLLTTFMRDRANQITLGTFISTFLYCVLVLRAVQSAPDGADSETAAQFVPHIAMFGGLVLAVCSIAVLIYFINHVPRSIHVSQILAQIGTEFTDRLNDRFPGALGKGTEDAGSKEEADAFLKSIEAGESEALYAHKAGYVRIIDTETLLSTAQEKDLKIALRCQPGDFVIPGQTLMTVQTCSETDLDEVLSTLLATVTLGKMRTPMQDIAFLSQELSEIAIRALSPGINDPLTAITAMDWLRAGLTLLGTREALDALRRDEDDTPRVLAHVTRFEDLLQTSLGAVAPSAARNVVAGRAFLQICARLEARVRDDRAEAVRHQRDQFMAIAREVLSKAEIDALEDMMQAAN